jgi:hypothetical protein
MTAWGGFPTFAARLSDDKIAPKTDYPDKRGQIARIDEAVIQGRAARGSGGDCNDS